MRRSPVSQAGGVAGRAGDWDTATAGVVLARLGPRPQPPLSFFTPAEEAAAEALLDHLLARRPGDPPVPVLSVIDARLSTGQGDGWRYADLPEDDRTWRRSLAALDEDARLRHDGRTFAALDYGDQDRLLHHIKQLGSRDWYGMPASHVWTLWTRYATAAYYAHPHAWDEIGFGGPAYPQGYLRLGRGLREPWEEPR
ncbi:gluconate 2-dehydrogenase subunit 3 family protein [Streptomyces orinoci]|uniref:Gluconate 2-dehydrogenase subunit 3 family protein n=1 Tax=Streptomyces orinoci TaxID=67339 RepID=A0ABV3JYS8_STRON|nr:gluconate 2-dehydrogenase subunit 3 family protein [Streptomyces orinoci]